MQISLTKKLAAAMGVKPDTGDESVNPLYCWTANWANTFENRKEDMVVMVNGATCFTVTIYGIKCSQFKNIEAKMLAAIRNTLLAMNLNPELVEEYMAGAGDITFASNHDRKMTARVNRSGLDAAFVVGRAVNESRGRIKFEDTLGSSASKHPAGYSNNPDGDFIPAREMIKALAELAGKPAYKYRAFELLVTLDLEIYKATRRLIVPADIEFAKLHKVLQSVFSWKNYHLYDFAVYDNKSSEPCAHLVPDEESLDFDDLAVLMTEHTLSEYLPKYNYIVYTYDMGDNWEHKIELIRVIDEHHEESPYMLEALGQAPPEDVGGVGGFIDFREIILNPYHPDYAKRKNGRGIGRQNLANGRHAPN